MHLPLEIEKSEDQIPGLAELAVKKAYEDAMNAGQSVLTAESGCIIEVFPDGSRREIKRIEPATPVTRGQIMQVR